MKRQNFFIFVLLASVVGNHLVEAGCAQTSGIVAGVSFAGTGAGLGAASLLSAACPPCGLVLGTAAMVSWLTFLGSGSTAAVCAIADGRRKKRSIAVASRMEKAFNELDADKNGFLTFEDMAMGSMETVPFFPRWLKEGDVNEDGKMSLDEWKLFHQIIIDDASLLTKIFRLLDEDENGQISMVELVEVMKMAGSNMTESAHSSATTMGNLDRDRDSIISLEEMVAHFAVGEVNQRRRPAKNN